MPRSHRTLFLAAAVSAALLSGCGSGSQPTKDAASSQPGMKTTSSPSSAPTAPAAASYRILSKPVLTGALVGVQTLPPGYSQDAPSTADPDKTFCNYKPPYAEKVYTSRGFTKGAGLSEEVLSVGLRQYADQSQAKAAFTALTKTLRTCTGEMYKGTKLTYALMSTAKVGDGSVGVKITADNVTLLQNFALVGPTLVSSGGGGLINASADEATNLLLAQVKAYKSAALR